MNLIVTSLCVPPNMEKTLLDTTEALTPCINEQKEVGTRLEVTGGCYVATAVYGSYDCPQVWTLRRFRDNTLAATWYSIQLQIILMSIKIIAEKWFVSWKIILM